MSAITLLSALAAPGTQGAAASLIEIAAASLHLVSQLDKPDMTEEEKMAAWDEIKAMNLRADEMINSAIMSHPAWTEGPKPRTPES